MPAYRITTTRTVTRSNIVDGETEAEAIAAHRAGDGDDKWVDESEPTIISIVVVC